MSIHFQFPDIVTWPLLFPRNSSLHPQISRRVLLRAFPSAVAVARPLSLSDQRPTSVYGWAVSGSCVGKLGIMVRGKWDCGERHGSTVMTSRGVGGRDE